MTKHHEFKQELLQRRFRCTITNRHENPAHKWSDSEKKTHQRDVEQQHSHPEAHAISPATPFCLIPRAKLEKQLELSEYRQLQNFKRATLKITAISLSQNHRYTEKKQIPYNGRQIKDSKKNTQQSSTSKTTAARGWQTLYRRWWRLRFNLWHKCTHSLATERYPHGDWLRRVKK